MRHGYGWSVTTFKMARESSWVCLLYDDVSASTSPAILSYVALACLNRLLSYVRSTLPMVILQWANLGGEDEQWRLRCVPTSTDQTGDSVDIRSRKSKHKPDCSIQEPPTASRSGLGRSSAQYADFSPTGTSSDVSSARPGQHLTHSAVGIPTRAPQDLPIPVSAPFCA
ncbi:hypothetical protein BD413DRAFT_150266 [Trametes elegans]|nr:hypothetical protein BD413DRAFT_150266 [Trametes elegans]